MSIRRSADSVYLQYIWNSIEADSQNGLTFQSILSAIQNHCDPKCTAVHLNHELANAIQDGCVVSLQGRYNLVKGFENVKKDRNDWYCFECHGPGLVVSCPTCFRVYHSECVSAARESHWSCRLPLEDPTVGSQHEPEPDVPPTHPCPVCRRLARVCSKEYLTSSEDLSRVFLTAFDTVRNRVHWKTMQKVGYLYEPLRNEYLVYRQINTRMIGDKLRACPQTKEGYTSRTSFLVDLDNLVHNAAVFYGHKHVISNMARQIRSQLRRAMRESVYCVDCYTRPSTLSPVARLTSACRKPHRLLWFQHNGWSFRPCKMLYESCDGYEVVCFGGRHEREFVPRVRAFEMTFTAPDLGLRMTPSLKKALDEAEEYKANQSAFDRNLPTSNSANVNQISKPPYHKLKVASAPSVSPIASTNSIPAAPSQSYGSRKRKAGPKYSVAFGSTDTESSASVFSTDTTNSKRRKSSLFPDEQPSIAFKRERLKIPAAHIDDNFRTSESDSDNYSNEEGSDANPAFEVDIWNTVTTMPLKKNGPPSLTEKDKSYPQGPLSSPRLRKTASRRSSFSKISSSSSSIASTVNSKPTIRIKPLPPLPSEAHTCTFLEKHENGKVPRVSVEHDGFKTNVKASTPSSSSAVSVPSSGCATLPATTSIGDPVSGTSSLSSFSPISSKRARSVSRRIGRPTSRRKVRNKCRAREKKGDDLDQSLDYPSSRQTKPQPDCPPVFAVTEHEGKELLNRTSLPRSSRSPSPLSSICDSDSSSSSLSQSPSSTTSSVLSSSSTVSSGSTIPSPSRRLSFSAKRNEIVKSKSAFAFNGMDANHSMPDDRILQAQSKLDSFENRRKSYPFNNSTNFRSKSNRPLSPQQSFARSSSYSRYPEPDLNLKANMNKTSPVQIVPNSVAISLPSLNGSLTISHAGAKSTSSSITSSGGLSTTRLPIYSGGLTPMVHIGAVNPPHGSVTTGPTPPLSSSASSSCYSSVSPAALSTTSGLGSSLSDPKSVDASPGEMATLLGNAPFACLPGGAPLSVGQMNMTGSDASLFKSAEDHVHRIYADRLALLTMERDQAREELIRRDALIGKLGRDHEAEIKRIKQLTWCQVCLNEAFYHCCPGTAYCSETCQLQHWTQQHNRDCRRRGEAQR